MPAFKAAVGYLHTVNGNLGRFDGSEIRMANHTGFGPKLVPSLSTVYEQRRTSVARRKAKGLPPVRYGYKRIVVEAA